jgi:hypothetical protein
MTTKDVIDRIFKDPSTKYEIGKDTLPKGKVTVDAAARLPNCAS